MNNKNNNQNKPVVALTLGDFAGIGAELIAKLLAKEEAYQHANIVLIGDKWLWKKGQQIAQINIETTEVATFADVRNRLNTDKAAFLAVDTISSDQVNIGKAEAPSGKASLDILNLCMDAALNKEIDAICFAPLNKYAMKMGGMQHEDELHHFASYLDVRGYFCEFNTLGDLWTSRVSSHIPLKDAASYLSQERIMQAAELIYYAMLANKIDNPKIAIAGFNPHNGDGGTCGLEEIEIIEPAIKQLQAKKWPTADPFHGPFPADTIFLKAQNKEYQAIVTMYHDQGQIAIKLMGFARGVTVQGGLPIPITTPAHGTAYDIAGKGLANVSATWQAFLIASRMGQGLHN